MNSFQMLATFAWSPPEFDASITRAYCRVATYQGEQIGTSDRLVMLQAEWRTELRTRRVPRPPGLRPPRVSGTQPSHSRR
jgi:hypothetical protein